MQLNYLKIGQYKNLDDLEITFRSDDHSAILVGNNGSGKSNIIEAISGIFAGLFLGNPSKVYKPKNIYRNAREPFAYIIEYIVRGHKVRIDYQPAGVWSFYVGIAGTPLQEIPKNAFYKRADEFLPSQVIANYSGEEARLFELYYEPFYKAFKSDFIKKGRLPSITQKMHFVNKYYWQIALITLLYSAHLGNSNVSDFLKNILGITVVDEITFRFNSTRNKRYPRD